MFKNIFNKFLSPGAAQEPAPAPDAEERVLALQAQNQQLKLELEQAQAQIRRLQDSLARQKDAASAEQTAAVQARLNALLADLARPAAQFLIQLNLVEMQGKTVQAQDTLAVARHLLRVLNNAGVEVSEAINELTHFDPDRHQVLTAGSADLKAGDPVVVRTPGLVLRASLPGAGSPGGSEQRLVKAGVQAAPDPAQAAP